MQSLVVANTIYFSLCPLTVIQSKCFVFVSHGLEVNNLCEFYFRYNGAFLSVKFYVSLSTLNINTLMFSPFLE